MPLNSSSDLKKHQSEITREKMTWANDNNDIKRPVFGFSVLLKCDNLTKEGSQVLCVQRPPLLWNFETKWCPGLIQSAWSEHTVWFDKIFAYLLNEWVPMATRGSTFAYREVMLDTRSFSSFMCPMTSFAMELWNEMMPRAYPICKVGAHCVIWQDFCSIEMYLNFQIWPLSGQFS